MFPILAGKPINAGCMYAPEAQEALELPPSYVRKAPFSLCMSLCQVPFILFLFVEWYQSFLYGDDYPEAGGNRKLTSTCTHKSLESLLKCSTTYGKRKAAFTSKHF